ncbi:MAG: uncharacterized protein KVP18_000220 [Porospora cf. gigantea A]|nr:MAG: hypothetical protein KVP18_000220 [Porospora cf. gigantea A]
MHSYVPFFFVAWSQVVHPDCEHPEWVKEEHEREDRRPLTWNHTEPVCDVFLESGPLLECLRTDYEPITDGCTQLEGPDFELCMYFHYEAFEKDCGRWQSHVSGKNEIVEPPDSVFHIVAS